MKPEEITFDLCALCGQLSDLKASHIIPSFVFKWLRDSSATGHIRFTGVPNQRVQDGWKPRMLCEACEQRFSVLEKAFAEKCFNPINNNATTRIQYHPWMLKFATSVSWRVLCFFKAIGALPDFPAHQLSSIDDTLEIWGQFLLGKREHPSIHEQHMFFVDAIESSSLLDMPANMNRYLLRANEVYVAHTDDSVITYAKMGKFVLFGFVEMTNPRRWKGTKINAGKGFFGTRNIEVPKIIGDFLMDRAQRAASKYAEISESQNAKIEASYLRNLDRAANSETFRAMHQDVLLFGKEAFKATKPKISPKDSSK